jgi:hypothetical protein
MVTGLTGLTSRDVKRTFQNLFPGHIAGFYMVQDTRELDALIAYRLKLLILYEDVVAAAMHAKDREDVKHRGDEMDERDLSLTPEDEAVAKKLLAEIDEVNELVNAEYVRHGGDLGAGLPVVDEEPDVRESMDEPVEQGPSKTKGVSFYDVADVPQERSFEDPGIAKDGSSLLTDTAFVRFHDIGSRQIGARNPHHLLLRFTRPSNPPLRSLLLRSGGRPGLQPQPPGRDERAGVRRHHLGERRVHHQEGEGQEQVPL